MALTTKGHVKIENEAKSVSITFAAKAITQQLTSLATEDSGRDASGVAHVEFIKPLLRKWEITLPLVVDGTIWGTNAELDDLITLIQGKRFYITIYDITTGAELATALHVYNSNSSANFYSGVIRNGIIDGFKFSAIEIGD